jgi:hypothetical protein
MIPDSDRAASRTRGRRWDNCVWKSLIMGTIWLAGATLNAKGQSQYLPYPSNQTPQPYYRPATPPSWSYDPYTSGLGPCPQGTPGDLERCRDRMPPTSGQPSYWSR